MVNIVIKEAFNLDNRSAVGVHSTLLSSKFRFKVIVTSSSSSSSRVHKGDWTNSTTTGNGLCAIHPNQGKGFVADLGDDMDATVTLSFKKKNVIKLGVGETTFTVGELVNMCEDKEDGTVDLMLFHEDSRDLIVAGSRVADPTIVRVGIQKRVRDSTIADDTTATKKTYKKRAMIITRGTRGDVQPFVALARGLAALQNWEIIFVTEMEFKDFIHKNRMLPGEDGRIRFRPTGGNTAKIVNSAHGQFAINFKVTSEQTNAMQKLFLSRTEYEFFGSEPAIYYWAKQLKPDLLIYGFTMASVAAIVSEVLKIPLVGFFLQPTCIPSTQYPPCLPLLENQYRKLDEAAMVKSHKTAIFLKYMMEHKDLITSGNNLVSMRTRRGLKAFDFSTSIFQDLKDKNYPIVVPINETLFGGKPKDWSENAVLTDCIFLRGGNVPPIAPDAQAFLDRVKAMEGGKVVILCFSSMPVTKSQIVSIALKLVRHCSAPNKVCVFALVGGKALDLPFTSKALEADSDRAVADGRLFLASRAPFGRLFPLVDAIVLHGGLGTTCEALQAQVPAIVTGVLLLDQRFWGMRCCDMGVGPFGSHIEDFPARCVEYVDKALAADSEWKENVVRLGAAMVEEAKEDPSGVKKNVDCFVAMAEDAKPYWYSSTSAFSAYDTDNSGDISIEEVTKLVQALNLEMSETEIQELFTLCDRDDNGSIDEEEFQNGMYQKFMELIEN